MNKQNIISTGLILLLLLLAFFGGYKYYPLRNPCTQIAPDTIRIYDTMPHNIPDTVPFYTERVDSIKYRDKHWMDSVIAANQVDTMQILSDYFAIHYYTRNWYDIDTTLNDTLMAITLEDAISQNVYLGNDFSYKYFKPTTIINNVDDNRVTYSRYLYAGLTVPVTKPEYMSIDLLAAGQKCYLGVGYSPGMRSLSLKGGVKLFQFRE